MHQHASLGYCNEGLHPGLALNALLLSFAIITLSPALRRKPALGTVEPGWTRKGSRLDTCLGFWVLLPIGVQGGVQRWDTFLGSWLALAGARCLMGAEPARLWLQVAGKKKLLGFFLPFIALRGLRMGLERC